MNELLFLIHIAVVCAAVLAALRHSYAALVSVVVLQLVIANLFVLKQVALFGLTATGSEIFTVSTMYGIGLIQQFYGDAKAQRAIYYGFALLLFFVGTATIHGWYTLVAVTPMSEAFHLLFGHTPRLVVACLVAYLTSEYLNLWLGRLARRAQWQHSAVRIGIVWCGQLVDTTLFGLIGLYGVMPHLGQVILFCMAVKTIAVLAISPMMMVAKHVMVDREA